MEQNKKDELIGKKFNKLLIIEVMPKASYRRKKYRCQCDCGNIVIVEAAKVVNNHTKSCGCIRKEIDYGAKRRKAFGVANRNALIYNYRHNAKYKGIDFNLTDEEMIKIFESDCYYCGTEPIFEFKKQKLNGPYKFNGIDRLDNEKGYYLDNVVPCCSKCNFIKNKYHHDEFIHWISSVYLNLKDKNIIK